MRSKEYNLRAGELRHILQFQKPVSSQDNTGFVSSTWEDVTGYCWGSVRPLTSTEIIRGEKVDSKITHRIQVRYENVIDPSNRIKFNNRIFNIESVRTIDEAQKTVVILAIEMFGENI